MSNFLAIATFALLGFILFFNLSNSNFELSVTSEREAIDYVRRGEKHLCITSSTIPDDFHKEVLGESIFKTCLSSNHPYYKKIKNGERVPIDKILELSFVAPTSTIFGFLNHFGSEDGWNNDKFPRKIEYKINNLMSIISIVKSGLALAYLPEYIIQKSELHSVGVSGCSFECKQNIQIGLKSIEEFGWMKQVFG